MHQHLSALILNRSTSMIIYQPFTYLITFIPTGQLYYGVRTKQKCHPGELWTTYFTSSKIVHQLIQAHGHDAFRVEIRHTFTTKEAAILWEHRVLCKVNAALNPVWLNQNNGDRKFFGSTTMKGKKHTAAARHSMSINSSGDKNPNYGKPMSNESKAKLSKTMTGRKATDETRAKLSRANTGENNPNFGKKLHWYNNGIDNSLSEQCPGPEWTRGRLWAAGHREKMMSSRAILHS